MKFIISIILYSLFIFNIKGDNVSTIIKFVKSKIGSGYIWGGFGQILTEPLLNELYEKYPNHIDKNIAKKWIGKEVYDNPGFVTKAFQQVNINIINDADEAWKKTHWVSKGTKSFLLKNSFVILYKYDDLQGKMTETGIYLGGGIFIHASTEGVVMGNLPYTWTHWGTPKGLY